MRAVIISRFAVSIVALLLVSFSIASAAPTLSVEIAKTPQQQEWGLMGRAKLPENQGMLFIYDHPQKMNFWMFNTFIDLSIAFIDDKNTIGEIYFMKAYPEKMDPQHPVKQLADIKQYWSWGSAMNFYRNHAVISKGDYISALEVNAGWFDKHGIKVGDKIILDERNHTVRFKK